MGGPSAVKCAVLSCGTKRKDGARLFQYSNVYDKHDKWLTNCQINPSDRKNIFICSKHFEAQYFFKRKLKRNAIPTLLLPQIHMASSTPEMTASGQLQTSVPMEIDHEVSSNPNDLPSSFNSIHLKSYSKSDEIREHLTLENISKLPDPYFDITASCQHLNSCLNCEKSEKNIEVYRRLNRKCNLQIFKLKSEKVVLSKTVKSLQRKNRTLTKKINDLKPKIKTSLNDVIDQQNKSEQSKNFCKMILCERKKCQKWADEFKALSQNMYYRSPKAYYFMRDRLKFDLPSKSSLIRWQPIKNVSPGHNNTYILNKLKEKIESLPVTGKLCSLIFDEIKIRQDLKYNIVRDCIDGFVDLGEDYRGSEIGTHVCVFMVRGLIENYKHILCYYVSHNPIKSDVLNVLISTNLDLCFSLGLSIRAVVCDQGSNNRKALVNLGTTKYNPVLNYNNATKIVGLFDSPHLIKSFRNALLTSDINCSDGVASWNIVRELYKNEQTSVTRMCPKLTEKHVNPVHFDKMKVKFATQVFSRSVVAGIKTMAQLNNFSNSTKSNVLATWNLFEKLDKLFDILNSKHIFNVNRFRSGLRYDEDSEIYKFLQSMLIYLDNIKLVNGKKVFSFDGMIQTINGILFLLKSITQENTDIKYILTSRLNQDALENSFALIRGANGNNFNPSVQEFNFTIAKLLSIKYLTSFTMSSNCEEDNDSNLLAILREEIEQEKISENKEFTENISLTNCKTHCEAFDNCALEETEEIVDLELLNYEPNTKSDASTRYFAGYLIQRVFKKYNCVNCALILAKENDYLECTSELLIHYKNYLNDSFGKLQTPSQSFFELCRRQIDHFEYYFKNNAHTIGLKSHIVKTLQENLIDREFYDKDHLCFDHRMFLLNLMVLILIRKHSKWYMERIKIENIEAFGNRKEIRKKNNTTTKDRRWRTIIN